VEAWAKCPSILTQEISQFLQQNYGTRIIQLPRVEHTTTMYIPAYNSTSSLSSLFANHIGHSSNDFFISVTSTQDTTPMSQLSPGTYTIRLNGFPKLAVLNVWLVDADADDDDDADGKEVLINPAVVCSVEGVASFAWTVLPGELSGGGYWYLMVKDVLGDPLSITPALQGVN